jgi:hypothetical protein
MECRKACKRRNWRRLMSAGRVNGKTLQRKIMNIGTETEREKGGKW